MKPPTMDALQSYEKAETPALGTIKLVESAQIDHETLSRLPVHPEEIRNDGFDYSKVVVKKPWGYEYLIFQNESAAVWILHLKPDAQTSMHCHPNKKTSLVILEGKAFCSTLREEIPRTAGQCLLIGKGVFHQTRVASKHGAFIMEIESPVNKRELIRLKDEYGRVGEGYETIDKNSFPSNYNFLSFGEPQVYYNVTKRYGQCTLTLRRIQTEAEFEELLKLDDSDLIALLKGSLIDEYRSQAASLGDVISVKDLQSRGLIKAEGLLEILLVKRNDSIVKISDYVMSLLKSQGVRNVFFVPGDANMHLVDSLGRHDELNYICAQTERVAAMAAEAYSKLTSQLGVLVISSGASATHAVTAVASAWTDSTSLLVISGQATFEEPEDSGIRQLGNKSLNIVDLVRPITKYAVRVSDPKQVRHHLEKAINLARSGRPGPVWIDLPIDLQGMTMDKREFHSSDSPKEPDFQVSDDLLSGVKEVCRRLREVKRPVFLVGNGVRISGGVEVLLQLLNWLKIPVLTSRRGADLLPEDHPLFFGRPGTYGQRRANFVIQNADLLLAIGARLSIPQIGRNYRAFARGAQKILVDIDPKELKKRTVQTSLGIHADARDFLQKLLECVKGSQAGDFSEWIKQCKKWREAFPPGAEPSYRQEERPNPYLFIETFSEEVPENTVLVVDGGPVMAWVMQTFKFKKGQRMISSTGIELPGFAVGGSIGASVGRDRGQVICLCEDRGFQLNLPELQTLIDRQLPVKIFVFKSQGNVDVRRIQREYFGGRYVGASHQLPYGSQDVVKVGELYGFNTFEICRTDQLRSQIRNVLNSTGTSLCKIQVEWNQEFAPRIVLNVNSNGRWVARPLEDMYPFLDRKTLRENMVIDLWEN